MNDFLDVTLLSLLQGVAEFLPISSSGHLVIAGHLLSDGSALMDKMETIEVYLHFGTILSVFAFYRRRIALLLGGALMPGVPREIRKGSWNFIARLIVSAAPAVPVYFIFKDELDELLTQPVVVGALLTMTGFVLMSTRFIPNGNRKLGFFAALSMGLGQAVALLPGISRSGMTIAAAKMNSVRNEDIAEFSFLMSAPLILGGSLLKLVKDFNASLFSENYSLGTILWGVALSAVVGYASLAILERVLKGRRFWLFGVYCAIAGALTVFCLK